VCISGRVLRGIKKPHECPAFGTTCTPQTPLGATMVSAEGACAAYYHYGRHLDATRRHSRTGESHHSSDVSLPVMTGAAS
jgi:hypothetical protein